MECSNDAILTWHPSESNLHLHPDNVFNVDMQHRGASLTATRFLCSQPANRYRVKSDVQ